MIKRPTWILLAVLALVIAAYFLVKNHPNKGEPTPTAAGDSFLFNQSDGILQSIRITGSQKQVFQMQKDLSKTWVMTSPENGVADQGLASAAETQVGALRIVLSLADPPTPGTLGLEAPAYTLEMGFGNVTNHKIEVGNLTPTKSGYYVRFDNGNFYVVSQSGIYALLNLLTAPPYPAMPTPIPAADQSTNTPVTQVASPTP
jgi:hypothetical protein